MLRDGTVLESRDALPGTLLHGRTVIGMDELIPGTHRACR